MRARAHVHAHKHYKSTQNESESRGHHTRPPETPPVEQNVEINSEKKFPIEVTLTKEDTHAQNCEYSSTEAGQHRDGREVNGRWTESKNVEENPKSVKKYFSIFSKPGAKPG